MRREAFDKKVQALKLGDKVDVEYWSSWGKESGSRNRDNRRFVFGYVDSHGRMQFEDKEYGISYRTIISIEKVKL